MKLKQLLGILLLCMTALVTAAAAGTQLTQVSAKIQGDATMVAIQASGTFTHTEYRPSENLLLVDLAGVAAAKAETGKTHVVHTPGVVGYRVVAYKADNGDEVTRIELTLAKNAGVNVAE